MRREIYVKIKELPTRPGLVDLNHNHMPIRKVQFANGEFYHITKRGIEKREIFLDDEDYFRFVNSLLIFNDKMSAPWASRGFWRQRDPASLCTSEYKPKVPIVEIHAFALMPNHFHLLVRQLVDNGIVLFMQKLGGYSYYFNKKYEREGTLFQNRYKIKRVKSEEQLENNFVYINTNPISIIESGWKEGKVEDVRKTIEFLENKYRWSSYWDYIGKKNFPSVITKDFFLEFFGEEEKIREKIESWILYKLESEASTRPGLVDFED
ncbi:MAG: transposase [Patescibacteria group bacterium]